MLKFRKYILLLSLGVGMVAFLLSPLPKGWILLFYSVLMLGAVGYGVRFLQRLFALLPSGGEMTGDHPLEKISFTFQMLTRQLQEQIAKNQQQKKETENIFASIGEGVILLD